MSATNPAENNYLNHRDTWRGAPKRADERGRVPQGILYLALGLLLIAAALVAWQSIGRSSPQLVANDGVLDTGVTGASLSSSESPPFSNNAAAPTTITPPATTYVVQDGDTLWDIAIWFNVKLDNLVGANELADPDLIMAGQVLMIPD